MTFFKNISEISQINYKLDSSIEIQVELRKRKVNQKKKENIKKYKT